jgi:hypothetical protein
MSLIVDGTTGVTFNDSSLQGAAASPYVLKNRIINGAMVIDQRNAGASVTPASGSYTYTVDRWAAYATQSSKFTVQQNAGAVTPPVGFTNYLGITSSSAYSVISSDLFLIRQAIEGFNIADLGWGSAGASPVTFSFWVRSSLTGTFGGSIASNTANYSYPFSYTISSANTWEQKTVTISAPTTGGTATFPVGNGSGFNVFFGIGVGSAGAGTAGSWTANTFYSSTGATSVIGTNGATWYITGVQLEIGTSATPFERRLYGQELINCQRYCYRITNTGATNNGSPVASGLWSNATLVATACKLPVTMRSAPTLSYSAIGDIQCLDRDVAWRAGSSSLVINEAGVDGVNVGLVCTTGSTQGFGTVMEVRVVSGWIQFSAEL